jgi:hypothetical protein
MNMSNETTKSPLKLSSSGYWKQIDDLEKDGILPWELGSLLKEIISSFFSRAIPAEATSHLVELAKQYLQGGIELSNSAMDCFYDVMVFVPNAEKNLRSFFLLVRKYPEGRLKYLDEI